MARRKIIEKLLNRYRVTVRNEDDFAERGIFILTLARVIVWFLVVFLISGVLTFFLGRYVFTEYYTSKDFAKEAKENELMYEYFYKNDTLEYLLERKQQFIESFQLMVSNPDSVLPEIQLKNYELPSASVLQNEIEITEPVKKSLGNSSLANMYFLPPINGYGISRGFDLKINHLGVDIVAKKGEPILSIADGAVIFASWTAETGYVIGVQHPKGIISFYKHNSVLLKKEGDLVKAGDAIAIIGNSGILSSGPHLHFEMWHDGETIDPEHYISFKK